MEEVVLDTSVVVKWFAWESGSEKAEDLLEKVTDGSLILIEPVILPVELGNALYYTHGYDVSKIRLCLDKIINMGIYFRENDYPVLFETAEFVTKYKLTFYDALFLSVAHLSNCKLITADRKHHKPEFYDKVEYI